MPAQPGSGGAPATVSIIEYSPGPAMAPSDGSPALSQDEALPILKGHLDHLQAQEEAGRVLLAGPWAGELLAGMAVLTGSSEDVADFLATDPAVQRKVLVPVVRPWAPLVGLQRLLGE